MEFSRDFKAIWWAILIIGLGYYLGSRLDQLQAGNPTWFDALVFIVWIALGLGPFFKEMEFLGFKLKQEVRELKAHVSKEVESLRAVIQNQEQRQSVTSNLTFAYPPPADTQLANLREEIRSAVQEVVGAREPEEKKDANKLSPDTQLLVSSRIRLEHELRALHELGTNRPVPFADGAFRRIVPVAKMTDNLVRMEVIPAQLARAIREVYSVCSMAIHGEDVSPAKINFVQSSAPEILNALQTIRERFQYQTFEPS